jgi:DNA-binding transcriptional ArsR family regulator
LTKSIRYSIFIIDNENDGLLKGKFSVPTSKATLITHPVRARILTALMGRSLTTQQIIALLPDVPQPSIYRHVRILAENRIIEAVEEVRVNGALVKVYGSVKGQTHIHGEDISDATQADHLRYFTTFLNTLADSFRLSLEQQGETPNAEWIHAFMDLLHLSPEEHIQFAHALNEFLQPWRDKAPDASRRRFVFTHIMMPDQETPPLS